MLTNLGLMQYAFTLLTLPKEIKIMHFKLLIYYSNFRQL